MNETRYGAGQSGKGYAPLISLIERAASRLTSSKESRGAVKHGLILSAANKSGSEWHVRRTTSIVVILAVGITLAVVFWLVELERRIDRLDADLNAIPERVSEAILATALNAIPERFEAILATAHTVEPQVTAAPLMSAPDPLVRSPTVLRPH